MKLNLFDSHVHSSYSADAQDSMDAVCQAALANGVMGVAFTDHYDCDMLDCFDCGRIVDGFREIPEIQERYKGRLRVTKGIELGQGHRVLDVSSEMLRSQRFDYVLGSVHCAGEGLDVSEINFNDPSVKVSDILDFYFQNLYDMTRWGKFDVMGHLGYPERYIWGKYRIPVDFSPYDDQIQATLKLMVEKGIGLEVNTSGYRQGLGKTIPVMGIIKRYFQLGGRIVTLGSDAHCAADVAADFGVAMDLLTGIGFEYFAFYRAREPVMLKLI